MNLPLFDSIVVLIVGIVLLGLAFRLGFWWLFYSGIRRIFSPANARPAATPEARSKEGVSKAKEWVGLATGIVGLVTALSGMVNSCSNLNSDSVQTETSYIETVDRPAATPPPYPISTPAPVQSYGTRCCTPQFACTLTFNTLAIGSSCICFTLLGGQFEGTVCQ